MPANNPSWLKTDVYNPIDVDNLIAGRCKATDVRSAEKAAAVQRLTRLGKSSETIAEAFGMSERHVQRLRDVQVRPPEVVMFDHGHSRITELSILARTAQRFAAGMRDDVESLWFELLDMEPQRMRELVMVLAAMVPVDQGVSDLLRWVAELPMPALEVVA
jgi:hypothetical protein